MAIISFQDALKKNGVTAKEVTTVATEPTPEKQPRFGVPSIREIGQSAKDIAIGAGKGALDTAIGTARLVTRAGQPIQAALDPTRTLSEVRSESEDSALFGEQGKQIDEQLKSTNVDQKTGKVLETVASFFYPVGKASEVAGVLNKTKGATGAVLEGIGSKISSLGDEVTEGGVKLKDKLIDVVTNLDDKTKTALQRTPQDVFQSFVKKGQDALLDDRNRTPLESVGDTIIDGLRQIKDRASSIGEQKTEYLNQAKVGFQKVGNIARQSALQVQKTFSGKKLDAGDQKAISNFQKKLMELGDNPSLKDVDATIDLLQDSLYKAGRNSAVEITDRVTGPLRKVLGQLNAKVQEKGGDAYKNFNKEYEELMDIVTELNARVGKEGASAGAFVKRLFSPSDARTKELFEQLEKYTGKDYTRDARLAKFVMETLGDTRAASLLEQIPRTTAGAIEKVIDYGVKKVQDPLKAAERFINKNKK